MVSTSLTKAPHHLRHWNVLQTPYPVYHSPKQLRHLKIEESGGVRVTSANFTRRYHVCALLHPGHPYPSPIPPSSLTSPPILPPPAPPSIPHTPHPEILSVHLHPLHHHPPTVSKISHFPFLNRLPDHRIELQHDKIA